MKKFSKLFFVVILLVSIIVTGCNKGVEVINDDIDSNPDNIDNNNDDSDKNNDDKKDDVVEIDKEAERVKLEELRKSELGEFYVPLPPLDYDKEKEKFIAKGLFLTGHTAGMPVDKEDIELYSQYINALINNDAVKINELKAKTEKINKFEKAIAIAKSTEINSFVIDVKDDTGLMTYKSSIGLTDIVNANRSTPIKDIKGLIELLNEYDIYPIARIVTFKDRNFANSMPEHSIQLKTGGVWKDYSGTSWVNPFDDYVWNYNLAIAKEAALAGFKEIQFDYVRFPDSAKHYNPITNFPGRNDRDKDEAIEQFLKYVKEELKEYNVNISADVFGVITKSWDDKPEDIGQTWRKIARSADVMSPMIYPSHYGPGWYGFKYPDANPYGVIKGALQEAIERNASLENQPQIRPWIQGFTAPWVDGHINYGVKELRDQIIAGRELGIDEYIVWSASNIYDPLAYIQTESENNKIDEYMSTLPSNVDLIGRTPEKAVKDFLNAEKRNIHSRLYLLTPLNSRSSSFEEFSKMIDESNIKLKNFSIIEAKIIDDNNAIVTLSYSYIINETNTVSNENDQWNVIKENNVWKVVKPEIKVIEVESETQQNN